LAFLLPVIGASLSKVAKASTASVSVAGIIVVRFDANFACVNEPLATILKNGLIFFHKII
jgi:hypothetical protein